MTQTFLIFFVNRAKNFFIIVLSYFVGVLFRCYQFVFCRGDGIKESFFLIFFCVDIQMFAYVFHQRPLVIAVVDGEIALVTEVVDIAAQNPHAGGVKGAHPYVLRAVRNNVVNALPHLIGSLICESEGQNLIGVNLMLLYQIGNAVSKNTGFAGTCSG